VYHIVRQPVCRVLTRTNSLSPRVSFPISTLNSVLPSHVASRSVIKKGSPLLRFNIQALTLLPPASERQSITPSEKVLEFLTQLSISSRDAASGLITSSLVAGRRSEAEDHGDVAFWVGVVDESRIAESILETLHISSTSEVRIFPSSMVNC